MPTPTAKLGLLKPSTVDPFSTTDIATNWQTIDNNPGVLICTSATRPGMAGAPAWGAAHKGREILETDTMLKWIWNGTAFIRAAPLGLLSTTGGGLAYAARTSNYSISSATYAVALTLANVVVPAGNRTLMVVATFPRATNSVTGVSAMGIWRTATANGTPRIGSWYIAGDNTSPTPGAGGSGGSYVTYEKGGLPAGVYTYTIQFARYGTSGTSVISADTTTPLELTVTEI